jgi:uncharacterized protein
MSQENVELAKRFNEAGRRGEAEAAFFQFVAEDVVATDFGDSLDTPNVVHGRNAVLDAYRQVSAVFDDYWREVDEYVEVGDWVIAVGRWVGTGKASGVPVERRGTNAGRWREGKIVEWLFGLDSNGAALEAVESRE